MAVVASLDVLLRAVTKNFDDGMRRSQKRLAFFGKASIGLGVAVGGATTALSVMRKEFEGVDAIAKQAARIGETTEEISRLQFAAELTGAGAEKLAAGLDVMQKRLGEAARGSGAAKVALESLGLSATELIELKPGEQFRIIAEAISALDTQSEKAAATANIFSRANQDLVNTLDLGAKGLAEAAEQSDKFGNTIKNETVASVESANDAVTKLTAIFKGLKRETATAIAPSFAKLIEETAELSSNLIEIKTSLGAIGAALPEFDPFGGITRRISGINELISSVKEGRLPDFSDIQSFLPGGRPLIGGDNTKVANTILGLENLSKKEAKIAVDTFNAAKRQIELLQSVDRSLKRPGLLPAILQ